MVATLIVFSLLFFLPLFVIPVIVSPFEAPKVILAEILIEFLVFVHILRASGSESRSYLKTIIKKQNILYLSLFLLSLISLISLQTPVTFFGNPFRHQGVFLLWHLLTFSILSSKLTLPRIPLIPLISLAGLLLGTLILGQNEAGRFYGTLGEPNALAAAAIFIWPFAFFNPLSSKPWIKPLSPLITLIILILSGSRSALLAFLIQAIFLLLTRFKPAATGKFTLLSIILITFSLIMPILEGGGWFENRSEVWSTSLLAGLQRPITGSGFGNMEYTLKETSRLTNNNIQYQYVDSSHNFILDFWVQGGLLGTGLIISTVFLSLLGLVRKKDRLLLCSFLGVLTVMSFNPISVVTLLAFWYLIGQGFSLARRDL
ncbi:MAG: Uncharacterized protein CEO21_108 [Microgenomates group bacterium Gr01-1014_80]|nr:MAG: Uncharacterized protein CEO21_108 [Microgenomates group bacterium Gr01-1014_80]